jgi:hypothetical protein
MNQDQNKKETPILLLPAPKNTGNTESSGSSTDDRKYGENTVRDPDTGRFVTGNPGKPVGAQHFSTMFKRVIRQAGGVAKDGQKVSYDEIIVKKVITMASEGNLKAAEIVLERVDGKVKQPITMDEMKFTGKVLFTKEEAINHETIFKRHDKQRTNNDTSAGDTRGTKDPTGSEKGSAYESR